MQQRFILGVDGGGSKTTALLADTHGTILGEGKAAASNCQAVGFAAATAALEDAIGAAFRSAGLDRALPVSAACFGMAGAGRESNRVQLERWVLEAGIAQRCVVVVDAEPVLMAGTPDGWGLALISGTGSFCYGRTPDGHTARVGGWGYLLGDEGSGYDLALRALRLATQTADGRAAAHALLGAILAYWGLAEPADLIGYVYRPELTCGAIAALSHPIVALAEAGDAHAGALLEQTAGELARLVTTAANKLGLTTTPVALAGGLFGASQRLREGVAAHTKVGLEPVMYVEQPARGALILARRLLGECGL
jgi:N-acetylglucosamine kinase-like BadF-type ATPase